MASPKHLTRTLFEHWETVEALVRATREMPAFSEEQVLAAIRQAQPALDDVQVSDALRKLFASGVLEVQSRSESFVVNAHVLEFVRGLTHEHELGLSSVIQARIDAIRGTIYPRLLAGCSVRFAKKGSTAPFADARISPCCRYGG